MLADDFLAAAMDRADNKLREKRAEGGATPLTCSGTNAVLNVHTYNFHLEVSWYLCNMKRINWFRV